MNFAQQVQHIDAYPNQQVTDGGQYEELLEQEVVES